MDSPMPRDAPVTRTEGMAASLVGRRHMHRRTEALFGDLPGFSTSRQLAPRLLIVHHTPSPHCQEMFEAVPAGATDPEIEGVEVVRRPALTVSPVKMLEADGMCLAHRPTSATFRAQ